MQKVVKCKLADMEKGQFYLVEALLKGNIIIHWMEFKHVPMEYIWRRSSFVFKSLKSITS
eukprot:3507948-Ditylum_brightwellii.AAC.1